MNSRIKRILRKIIPDVVFKYLFPRKFKNELHHHFISIEDYYSENSFQMLKRPDGWIENDIARRGLYGGWEKESLKIWVELSKRSQTIIDIGANTGIYSLLAQNNNRQAKIIAIEPININYKLLSKNILQNRFPIHKEKIALSDKDGTAKMFMIKDKVNYMTSVNDNRYALHPEIKGDLDVVEIKVKIKPYSYIHEKYKLNSLDLIKIDVEGHELAVLNAMVPYLEVYKPNILIEVIGVEHAKALDNLFKKVGYKKYLSIDEINKSVIVDNLWDNDHHNFLICDDETIQYLQKVNLIA